MSFRTESSSESQDRMEKLHITSKGKEGKVLRKKLAIALGLRTNSSASTTSQSEGEEVQSVVEVFRRQVRKTADSRSRNFPRTIQEREQQNPQNPDKSSLILRKTVRKTTGISDEFLEEDFEDFDDIDGQETVFQKRSKEQYLMTAEKLETFDHAERRSRDAAREKHKAHMKTTGVESIGVFLNEDINEKNRASRKTKKIQDNLKFKEMTDKNTGKRLHNTKMENEDKSGNILKTESWELETRNERQNESILASTSDEVDLYNGSNVGANLVPSEVEIFSSFGEQSEKAQNSIQEVSPRESVKLLREKIRKNARARQVRRSSRVGRDLEENSRDIQNQEKIASRSKVKSTSVLHEYSSIAPEKDDYYNDQFSSNIPIPIMRRKTSDTQARPGPGYLFLDTEKAGKNNDVKKEIVQKSKIPRRKSQNSKDEMGTYRARVKFDEIEGKMVDAHSHNIQSIDDHRLSKRLSKDEDVEREKFSQQFPWQKRSSNTSLGQLLRKVSKKTDSTNMTSTNNNNLTNKSQTELLDSTIVTSRHDTSSVRQFDFDSFEAELRKLKESVFKTYEEFKDIKSMALNVEEELTDLRSTYGVSY